MDRIDTWRLSLPPPHRAGQPFIAACLALIVLGLFVHHLVVWVGVAGLAACLAFFRDPERTPPSRPGLILAPADGVVVSVGPAAPPAELDMGAQPRVRVAIFLSVLNVHVNRVPAAGIVRRVAYHPGQFLSANHDKAAEVNERNAIAIDLPDGRDIAVVQIAGLIARRILCGVRAGDPVAAGDRFGIIRFGSRTDLYLPPGVTPLVAAGQTMVGGETVIAALA